MANKVCVVIAVSEPDGLEPLPGAIPSAERLASWATKQGYDTKLIRDVDENNKNTPVTCELLRETFANALGAGGQDRILVAFVGHGLIRGASEEYWLLTDWRTRATEAVNHMKLRDRLETYRPKQIGVISDACRSFLSEPGKWVEGNGVVDVLDYAEQPVQVARLAGSRAAQPAYATPLGAEEKYCFFTQVLVNALEGSPEDVIEQDDKGRRLVLSDKLVDIVERELPLLASRYQRQQVPQLEVNWRSRLPDGLWSVLPSQPVVPPRILAPAPVQPARPPAPPTDVIHFRRGGGFGGVGSKSLEGPDRDDMESRRTKEFWLRLRQESLRAARFDTDCGVVVNGASVMMVVTGPDFRPYRHSIHGGWFELHQVHGDARASSVMALLSDARWSGMRWIGAAAYRDMVGTFSVEEDGADAYVLRSPLDGLDGSPYVDEAVARVATNAVSDPYEIAALVRRGKHADPVLGALAAYAYARAGAIDDIRRTCYFYTYYNQPLPFDAALLGRVRLVREGRRLMAEIPAVPQRKPRNATEAEHPYTYEATPGGRVPVAGGFPWLREGWALLEDRREFRGIAKFAKGLRRSVFTTFEYDHGEELAAMVRRGEL